MNWFPNFLSPLAGMIAAAVAVPALLVLYFLKLRRREFDVSSTLLWKKAIQDLQVNAPFQKLRRNLLLILQMALLMALCLALTRPITFFHPGAGKTTVILIDRSASMSATDIDKGKHSRLDEAKRRAKELVSTMERGASAMVIAFDDQPATVQPFTTDTSALRTAIDNIQPTDRKTRMKGAYQLAEANMGFNPDQLRGSTEPPDVEIFSDGRVLDASELSIKGTPRFNQIGTEDAPNVAVVALSAKRNYERPTEVQIFARLANYGAAPITADVELAVAPLEAAEPSTQDFKVRGVATVNLPPARWSDEEWLKDDKHRALRDETFAARDSVEFTLDLTTAATIRVEQKAKEGDALAADDVAYVSLPPPKALSVLLVTDGNYFLEKLLSSLKLRNPQVMSPVEYESKLPTTFDVIIFDRAYTPPKLPPAGNFIYFGSIAPGLKLSAEMENGKTAVMETSGVLDWKRDHPILKGLSLGKIHAADGIKLKVPLEAEILVDGTQGPLIVLDHEGRSTHLAIAFDSLESNWPTSVSFPIFMYQALQYMAIGTDLSVVESFAPGATPRISRTSLAQVSSSPLKSIRLNGPGGSKTLAIPEAGDFALPPLEKVGVYSTDPLIPQFERIVVNLLDENESNLMPAPAAPGGIGTTIVTGETRARLDLWWWIVACLAMPLLVIEWFVYTRRVHL